MRNQITPAQSHLLPGLFQARAAVNEQYLLELDSKALLQNFYLEAGIQLPGMQALFEPESSWLHWGWESPSCQLRGHFLGHWLSAASLLYAQNGSRMLKARIDDIVDELETCQRENGGEWLASIPEKYFDRLEKGMYIWSPQYTMHKTVLGLMHTYQYAGNEKSLKLLSGLADWYLRWTGRMLEVNPAAICAGETGGMLEVWATLYQLTDDSRYLELAERYSHQPIFDQLLEGKDPLTGAHTNASIPHAHGAAKMYEVTGDEKWLKVVKAFWACAVTNREYFCTGGQSAGEFWIPAHALGEYRTDRTQEFCTVYNMVRLADYLFRFTGDETFEDYIERNLYNGFLAQQNRFTGMPTYFLPMRAGSHKKWGSKTHDFWCCHGTTVQAHTIYPLLCYTPDPEEQVLWINQYIPSAVDMKLGNTSLKLSQAVDMKYYNSEAFFDDGDASQMSRWQMKFEICTDAPVTLRFRMPGWMTGAPVLTLDGQEVTPGDTTATGITTSLEGQVLSVTGTFKESKLVLFLPAGLSMHSQSDQPEKAAFLEGPIVLAGLTETEPASLLGGKAPEAAFQSVREHSYETFPWLQSHYNCQSSSGEIRFIPLYEVNDEAYTLYFTK